MRAALWLAAAAGCVAVEGYLTARDASRLAQGISGLMEELVMGPGGDAGPEGMGARGSLDAIIHSLARHFGDSGARPPSMRDHLHRKPAQHAPPPQAESTRRDHGHLETHLATLPLDALGHQPRLWKPKRLPRSVEDIDEDEDENEDGEDSYVERLVATVQGGTQGDGACKGGTCSSLGTPRRRGGVALQDDEDDDEGVAIKNLGAVSAKPQHCAAGKLVYLKNTTVVCGDRTVPYSGLDAKAMHIDGIGSMGGGTASQENCTLVSNSTSRCVCPPDAVPEAFTAQLGGGVTQVFTKCRYVQTQCHVRVTSPDPNDCPPFETNLDWLLPCRRYRLSDEVQVSFRMHCEADYEGVGVRGLPAGEEVFAAGEGFATVEAVLEGYEMKARGVGFRGFSPDHPMMGEEVAARLYDFNRPSMHDWSWRWAVASLPFGQVTSLAPFEAKLTPAAVPAQYFHGGRLYMEVGLLNSPNHTAKLFLDFDEYTPVEPVGMPQGQKITFILLFVGCLVFTFVGCTLYYRSHRREKKLQEKED